MTIQSMSNRQAAPLAAVRLNNARTAKLSKFVVDEPLAQSASSRRLVAASPRGRQIAVVPDRRSAASDPVAAPTTKNTTDFSNPAPLQSGRPQPFYVTNSNYNPADANSPETIQDPTATAAPQLVQWTSPNDLTTTGVINPFGLTQNNPCMGFYGASSNPRF